MAIKTEDKYTTTKYLSKLKEKIGAEETADYLGCSANHVTQSIKENRVCIAYELAAEHVYQKKYGENAVGQCAIIHAPPMSLKPLPTLSARWAANSTLSRNL